MSAAKGNYLGQGGKLSSVGLPIKRTEGGSASMQLSASKSFNAHGVERVSLYRNEEDRQSVMKQINE